MHHDLRRYHDTNRDISGRTSILNRGVCNNEESFEERRERARSLPPEYTVDYVRWIDKMMDAEAGAAYYGFSWWTKAAFGRDFRQMAQRLKWACQDATCDHFPTLPRSSLNRIPPHLCVSAIMLPAQKRDGVPHVHGFLRVPVAALDAPFSPTIVQTHGSDMTIQAPHVIAQVVLHLRHSAQGGPTSLHIDHRSGYAVDFAADRTRRQNKFDYLTAFGAEVRSWDRVEWVPKRVWEQLAKRLERSHGSR